MNVNDKFCHDAEVLEASTLQQSHILHDSRFRGETLFQPYVDILHQETNELYRNTNNYNNYRTIHKPRSTSSMLAATKLFRRGKKKYPNTVTYYFNMFHRAFL
jgi:hypothetical protein